MSSVEYMYEYLSGTETSCTRYEMSHRGYHRVGAMAHVTSRPFHLPVL